MGRSAAPDTEFYAEIVKVDEEQRTVHGYASTDVRDRQGEIVTKDAVRAALPEYMLWKNVREMHQPKAVGIAIEAVPDNKGLWFGAKVVDDQAWRKVKEKVYKGFSIGGRVTSRDPLDKTIVTGVQITEISLVDRPANPDARFELIKRAGDLLIYQPIQYWGCGCHEHQHLTKAEAQTCMGEQADGLTKLYETTDDGLLKFNPNHGEHGLFSSSASRGASVDNAAQAMVHASNHESMAASHESVAKSEGADTRHHLAIASAHHQAAAFYRAAGNLYQTSNPLLGDKYMQMGAEKGKDAYSGSAKVGMVKIDGLISYEKRDFSTKEREHAADTGAAMPGGGYPIENVSDLHNAIQAYGRAKDPEATKAHIKARAKALGVEKELPDDWNKGDDAADLAKATPRHIMGGQFAGHSKSAAEAGAKATEFQTKSNEFHRLSKKHQALAEESAKAGNPRGEQLHMILSRGHAKAALAHEKLADRYTRLAASHEQWAQKFLAPASNDSPAITAAKQKLAALLKTHSQTN